MNDVSPIGYPKWSLFSMLDHSEYQRKLCFNTLHAVPTWNANEHANTLGDNGDFITDHILPTGPTTRAHHIMCDFKCVKIIHRQKLMHRQRVHTHSRTHTHTHIHFESRRIGDKSWNDIWVFFSWGCSCLFAEIAGAALWYWDGNSLGKLFLA